MKYFMLLDGEIKHSIILGGKIKYLLIANIYNVPSLRKSSLGQATESFSLVHPQ